MSADSAAAASAAAAEQSGLRRWIPGLNVVATYRMGWLPRDLVAGLVLSTLLVPQGMAYAELAGLPAITGLYTSIWCLLAYAVFGPSRILVLGPDSSLGPMIAAVVIPIVGSGGDPERAVALASMLALLVGVMMAVAGIAKLGFIADLLSKPTQIGYMNGLALTILISQLPKLFGFSVDGDGLIAEATGFVRGVANGEAVGAAIAIGGFGLLAILALNRLLPKVPAILVAVVASIVVASLFDVADRGVDLVGPLPKGFPPFTVPLVGWTDLPLLLGGALGITLVSLTDTISTASSFAARTGQEVRGNQEMIGIGSANLAASLFQGFPVSTSGSRTAVASQSGARTQLTFSEEPINEGGFLPGAPNILFYMQDVGGGEFYQVYRLDRGTGRSELLTDGKSRHEGLLRENLPLDGWIVHMEAAEADIDLALFQGAHLLHARELQHLDLKIRVGRVEATDHLGQRAVQD